MKLKLLVGFTITAAGAALAAACADNNTDPGSSTSSSGGSSSSSSSGSSGIASSSGGSSSSSGGSSSSSSGGSSSSSGGSSSSSSGGDAGPPAPKNTKLKAGDAIYIGVTTGATPHAIYYLAKAGGAYDVEAVPVAGGASEVLQANIADDDYAFVSGGAVAWYTGTNPTSRIATSINVWTKASGKKTVTTATREGIFAASPDGALVAFSVNAAADTTDVAMTTAAAPSAAAPALAGANAINMASAAQDCSPSIGFAGNVLVGAYCTGVDAAATQAKLVTAAAGAAAVVRIDNAVAADSIQPGFIADSTGGKLFVRGLAPDNQGRIVLAGATTTVAPLENGVTGAAISKDNNTLLFTAGAALKKATFAATPVITPLIATNVKGMLGVSSNSKHVMYYTQEDAANQTIDIQTVDYTAATPAAIAILATPTGAPSGFTGSGSHVVYVDEFGATTGKLKSKPAGGGAEKVLDAASYLGILSPVGTGVLSVTAAADAGGGFYSLTVKYSDAAVGGALQTGASDVLYGNAEVYAWSGKNFVHTNISAAAPGIYSLSIP